MYYVHIYTYTSSSTLGEYPARRRHQASPPPPLYCYYRVPSLAFLLLTYNENTEIEGRKKTHPHSGSTSGCSVVSTISSSKIRSSPPNTDISRRSAAPRVPPSEFHVLGITSLPSSQGCEKDNAGPPLLFLSRTLSLRFSLSLSFSLFLAHSFSSSFLTPWVPLVRSARSYASLTPFARPRTPLRGGGRGGQTTHVLIKHTSTSRGTIIIST